MIAAEFRETYTIFKLGVDVPMLPVDLQSANFLVVVFAQLVVLL